MVLRRIPPHDDPQPPNRQAAFRRTPRQAAGRGLYLGALTAALLTVVAAAVLGGLRMLGARSPAYPWTWILVFGVLVVLAVCAVRVGVDADDRGLHAVPRSERLSAPWPAILDVRTERRRSRTVVAVYLDDGAVLRLRAPYDGRLLAHDPAFERKMFTLLNVWETHRNWHGPA